MTISNLQAAVDAVGNRMKLAELASQAAAELNLPLTELKLTTLNSWFRPDAPYPDRIPPAEWCIAIERATEGKVTRHDLRPDIYPCEGCQALPHKAGREQEENNTTALSVASD